MLSKQLRFFDCDVRLLTPDNQYINTEGPHNVILNITQSGLFDGIGKIWTSNQSSHYILIKLRNIFDLDLNPDFRLFLPFEWETQLNVISNYILPPITSFINRFQFYFYIYLITIPFEFADITYTTVLGNEVIHEYIRRFQMNNASIAYNDVLKTNLGHYYIYTAQQALLRVTGFLIKPYMRIELTGSAGIQYNFDSNFILNMKTGPGPFITV